MPIVWTAEVEDALLPRTREAMRPLKKPTRKTAWSRARKYARNKLGYADASAREKARAEETAERRAISEALLLALESEAAPEISDLGAEGLLAVCPGDDAMWFAAQTIGAPRACAAAVRALLHRVRGQGRSGQDALGAGGLLDRRERARDHATPARAVARRGRRDARGDHRGPGAALAGRDARAEALDALGHLAARLGARGDRRAPLVQRAPAGRAPLSARARCGARAGGGEEARGLTLVPRAREEPRRGVARALARGVRRSARRVRSLARAPRARALRRSARRRAARGPREARQGPAARGRVLPPLSPPRRGGARAARPRQEQDRGDRARAPRGRAPRPRAAAPRRRSRWRSCRPFQRPPWLEKKRPKPPFLPALPPTPARAETIVIDPAVAELALAEARAKVASPIPSELLPAVRERGLTNHMDAFVVSEGRIPDELFLELWTAGAKLYSYDVDLSDYAVARFGERALEGLEWYLAGSFAYHDHVRAESLLGVDSARCTLPLARLALRIGHLRAVLATRWLRAHRETSAFVLGPAVVSGQRHFAPLFRELARGLDLERVLAPWGEEVTRAVLDWLAFDPRGFAPAKAPKMPPAWRPEALPRPTPRDGRALPLEAVRTIGVMLAISLPDALYAGLEDLKGVCEPRSLAELAWEIARAWEDAGARPGSAWMRDALVHLADDEVVRRTTPAMKVHHVLDALIQMGTPAAQMELATISACCAGKRPSWRDRAERGLEAIAARHGISKDEFDDALVPVAAVDARGELELDYGPRKIKVGFDAHLEPYTITAEGARSRALPPTRKRDDPDKVEEAKRIWLDLKEDVAVLAARRLRSLERAMCAGRRWSAEAFARAFLGSPLALHLARGLIWLAEPATLFRVAEDTTLAGADDERVILGERSVRVPHPMQMKPEALARWSEVLADYEIVQPFAQLARAVRGLPESAREDESDLVLEMSAKGWGRPSGQVRPLYQTPGHLHLHDQGSKIRLRFGHVSSPWKLERVVALDISEALYDLLG